MHGPGVNNVGVVGDNKNIKDQEGGSKLKEENTVLLKKIAGKILKKFNFRIKSFSCFLEVKF